MENPLSEQAATSAEDAMLVDQAKGGSRDALERLIERHQSWIFNVVLRMLYVRQDAEDTTQEILVKVITKLSTFEGRSSFRTWLYRLVINHVLNVRRRRWEEDGLSFQKYGDSINVVLDEAPDPAATPADLRLLEDEARIGCTSGMLLCLDREQRLVYVLGAIFGVTDGVGAELLETTPANFRQKLSRARRDLRAFMQNQCGLINTANPCRCVKKMRGFAKAGYLDPTNLVFARERVVHVRDVAAKRRDALDALDEAYAEIHRDHPFQDGPDFLGALRVLINGSDFQSTLEPK
ncbi:MAG TPA: RNA polymerase sigma factor [Vicinamibacterales bacterium]|nr:RNA polymerase sigma factor [Vicinamibacterales bacterium]